VEKETLPAAFNRCELYGSNIEQMDTGWIEGLRIHPA